MLTHTTNQPTHIQGRKEIEENEKKKNRQREPSNLKLCGISLTEVNTSYFHKVSTLSGEPQYKTKCMETVRN